MIIAVDGPAASGKGTIAKALADHYGLPLLDTGLLYRAVGVQVLRHHGDPANAADALAACVFEDDLLADSMLRTAEAGDAASKASVHPAVRAALLERQRSFANQPGGAILDGRDIGTVIAPQADAKLYVTASARVRAERRIKEFLANPDEAAILAYQKELEARDERDMNRADAPLRPADDALLLDTSDLTIDAAVQQAIRLVETRISRQQ
ncbi:(d)CMP kinase [Pseudonocardia sp. TMWB2A]|uniref:(d)CMP kinase n=1 Tax=Pseudonocardia sp. TMWB2A TaxID=687430 RepID=UPI00307EF9AE